MNELNLKGIGNTKIKPINFCGKTVGWILESEQGLFAEPKKTKPTKGEHDFNTCEGCQNTHKELIKRLSEKFNGTHEKEAKPFPYCCPHHSNLTKVKEFNKISFASVPKIVADKIIYTNQHIKNNHQKEDYYKDITDYIEYTVQSFGQMPKDCGEPLYLSDFFFYVADLLERNTEILKERKDRLIESLNAYQTPPTKNVNTDLNILLTTYQKWLNIFPFEISFFSNLKKYFTKTIPIISGKPEVNMYTGLAKVQMHTQSSLIDVLQNLTLNLLDKINVPELRKQGVINDIQTTQLEFSEATIKTKSAEITKQFSKGELKYIKALKKWLQIHKDYFKENEAIFKALPPQQSLFSVLEWATIFYYADETKLLSNKKAVKDRWEQFMKKYAINTTSDNFKKNYYDAKKRLNKKNNYPIDKLKFIIPFLEENYQQAVTKVKNDITFLETEQSE